MNELLNDRYQILQPLGQGFLSRTDLALDTWQTPPQPCVLKILRLETSPDLQKLHQNLSQILLSLRHPNLSVWLDSSADDRHLYYVQAYVPGDDLEKQLTQRLFQVSEIWQILETLLPALAYLHAKGLLHGDIKPSNLIARSPAEFRTAFASLVLVDFAVPTIGGAALSNPEYAAPEQIQGQACCASDLYSLGLTCLHLLTGIRPIELVSLQAWTESWSIPDADRASVEKLIPLLDRLIAPDLSQRFATAAAAIATLEQLRGRSIKASQPAVAIDPQPDQAAWTCTATWIGHQGLFASINAVALSADGTLLASASDDKTIRLWSLPTDSIRDSLQEQYLQGQCLQGHSLQGHQGAVKAVAFHPQQPALLASGSHDRTIRLWDTQTQQEVRVLTGHTQAVNAIAFSSDGQLLVSGSSDKTIKLWQVETGTCWATLSGHRLAVNALAFDCNQGTLRVASGSSDATLRLWDVESRTCQRSLTGHTQAIRTLAIGPAGEIASAGEDRTIRLWTPTGDEMQTLPGHPWTITNLVFIEAGTTLVSASWDQTLKFWSLPPAAQSAFPTAHPATSQATRKPIAPSLTLTGHTDSIHGLACNADRTLLASGSKDGTIKLWQPCSSSAL